HSPGRVASAELAVAHRVPAATVLVDHLLLLLHQHAVELVGQEIDGRVHVGGAGVGVERLAGHHHGGFGAVVGLVDAELGPDLERRIVQPRQAPELALDVVAERRGDVHLLAMGLDEHRNLLSGGGAPPRGRAADGCIDRLTHPPGGWKRHRTAVQEMRTRSCEEGMLRASRYLATVRRATGTPLSLRRSARRASDSGRRGSSASTRRRIMSWMATLEASPPPPVSMPEAKKARSGMVPRGVCTYLRATARETVDSCMPICAATSRRVSGRRACAPNSRKPDCSRTRQRTTFSRVSPRASRFFSSQRASCSRPRR